MQPEFWHKRWASNQIGFHLPEVNPHLQRFWPQLGLEEGARATFDIPAGEAFGDRNPEMQQWVAKTLLAKMGDPDERYAVGDVVQFPTPDGLGSYAGAVIAANDTAVQFDFNHPLAGQPVTFEVQLIGVL